MLYSEIIAVCSQIHTKHINTLCGQNVELLNVEPSGTYSNRLDIFTGYGLGNSASVVIRCIYTVLRSLTHSTIFWEADSTVRKVTYVADKTSGQIGGCSRCQKTVP
jgi:hypothetical protein